MAVIGVLLGAGAGAILLGCTTVFASAFDPTAGTKLTVIGAALICTAAGAWMPQRLVASLLRSAWMRIRGLAGPDAGTITAIVMSRGDADPFFAWLLLAATLTLAGVVSVFAALAMRQVARLDAYLLATFLWSDVTLRIIEVAVVFAGMLVPWTMIGMALACAYTAATRCWASTRSAASLLSLVVFGAAVAAQVGRHWVLPNGGAGVLLMTGALPLLLAAIVAGLMVGQSSSTSAPDAARRHRTDPPEENGEHVGLLFVSLIAWGAAVGLFMAAWDQIAAGPLASTLDASSIPTWFLIFGACGMAVAGRRGMSGPGSMGEYGVMLVVMGSAHALVIVLAVRVDAPHVTARSVAWLWPTLLAGGGLATGAALPFAKRALMARSGSESLTQARLVGTALIGVAGGAALGGAHLSGASPFGMLAAGALLVMALGGTLMIHERSVPGRHTIRRVAALFAALTAFASVLPPAASRWVILHDQPVRTPSRTARAHPVTLPISVHGGWVGGIGLQRETVAAVLRSDPGRVDLVSLDGRFVRASGAPQALATRMRPIGTGAIRALRLTRTRYDALVLDTDGHPARDVASVLAYETLQRLRRRLAPGGSVMIRLPAARAAAAATGGVAGAFAEAFPERPEWMVAPDGAVWLVATDRGNSVAGPPGWRMGGRVEALSSAAGVPGAVHSLWSPRQPTADWTENPDNAGATRLEALIRPERDGPPRPEAAVARGL